MPWYTSSRLSVNSSRLALCRSGIDKARFLIAETPSTEECGACVVADEDSCRISNEAPQGFRGMWPVHVEITLQKHRLERTRKTIRRGDEEGVKPVTRAIETRFGGEKMRGMWLLLRGLCQGFYLLSRKTCSPIRPCGTHHPGSHTP